MPALIALMAFGVPILAALAARFLKPASKEWGKKAIGVRVPATKNARRLALRRAVATAGLDDAWLRFFEQTAWRESSFNPNAVNASPKESAAALRSAERNVKRLEVLTFPWEAWGFGSAGLFQFLGPIAALDVASAANPQGKYRFSPEFLNARGPRMAKDPGVAVAVAVDYAKGLTRWGNFKGTWASLNIGWGNPSKMGKPGSLVVSRQKMEARASQLGYPPGWADEKISPIGDLSRSQLEALAGAARAAYEHRGGENA